MTTPSTDTPKVSMLDRILHPIPCFGWMVRHDTEANATNAAWFVGAWVAFWGCCILLFGLPGLIFPALFMTFSMFVIMILISRG